MFLGVRGRVSLDGNIWPFRRVFGVKLEPAFQPRFRVGLDGVSRAFGFTYAAVDAFIGVDDQHVLAFVETIDRADFNTVHVLALDAVLGDDIGHVLSIQSGLTGFLAEGIRACTSFFHGCQVKVKLARHRGRPALVGFAQDTDNLDGIAKCDGKNILRLHDVAAFLGAFTIDADLSFFDQVGGQ
jgi:hypothetical protein